MPQAFYVNLPVAALQRSRRFFEALGFSFNEQFSNDQAAALAFSNSIFVKPAIGALTRFETEQVGVVELD